MVEDYEGYEQKCEEIRRINLELLKIFEHDLEDAGLKEKTISSHLSNVDFYINDFLLYSDALSMEHGIYEIGMFLGDFFIRKCMWSTPGTIKSTAASIKKFYKSMMDHGKIEKGDYAFLCQTIKEEMDEWQSDCARFNDSMEENPFAFF